MNYFTRSLPELWDRIFAPIKKFFTNITWKPIIPWNKAKIMQYLGGFWTFIEKIIAPSIVIGGITTAAHLEGIHGFLFMVSALIVYWTILHTIEKKQTLNIVAKTTFTIPGGMDIEDVADLIRENGKTLEIEGRNSK